MLVASIISLLFLGGDVGRETAAIGLLHHNFPIRLVQLGTPRSPTAKFGAPQCRGIADLSASSRPLFQEKENGEWECSYLLEYSETGHKPSVFIQIRGTEPGIWNNFRLKLNFGSLLSRQILGNRAATLVSALIETNTSLKDLDVELATGNEFDMKFRGITLKYKQERGDTTRFNLFGSQKVRRAETSARTQQ